MQPVASNQFSDHPSSLTSPFYCFLETQVRWFCVDCVCRAGTVDCLVFTLCLLPQSFFEIDFACMPVGVLPIQRRSFGGRELPFHISSTTIYASTSLWTHYLESFSHQRIMRLRLDTDNVVW